MEIYQRYGAAVLRKCERILGNRSDAEDVMQGLFMDLLNKGKTDVDLPYLYRAATNRCLNQLRDQKRHRELLAQEAQSVPVGRSRLQYQVVTLDLLIKLLAKLDGRSAEILVYSYLDDFSQEQIATLLGISRRTVWSCLQKIRNQAEQLASEPMNGDPHGNRGGM